MSILNKIPWTILLVIYALAAYFLGKAGYLGTEGETQDAMMGMAGISGLIFIGLGVVVLFAEFFKSGDISTGMFMGDLVGAVIALIAATTLLCYLIFGMGQWPNFYHWFGYAIIIGDAILSPFNSFRTALRNFGVGNSSE
jgi:hypothetical protein